MSSGKKGSTLAMLTCVCLLSWVTCAAAADNSRIIVIEKTQRTTPFGSYRSDRQTQVYGPSSGYRYEEYRYPAPGGVIVSPYGYGAAPGVAGEARVFEHPGASGYGRLDATPAPRVDRYIQPYYGRHSRGRAYGQSRHHAEGGARYSRGAYDRLHRDPSARQITPAQRAIQPAERAIGSDRRR